MRVKNHAIFVLGIIVKSCPSIQIWIKCDNYCTENSCEYIMEIARESKFKNYKQYKICHYKTDQQEIKIIVRNSRK